MPPMPLLRLVQPFAFAAVFIALYIAEHLYPQRRGRTDRRHDAKNIGIGLLNLIIVGGAGYLFQQYMTWTNGQGFGLLNIVPLPAALRYGIEILLLDGFMYAWHRANHRWPLLWRFHAFHHEDRKMNSTTALRFHMVELLLSFVARMAFFPLAGISITGFLIYGLVFTAVVLFHHSAVRLSLKTDLVLRRVIVTPHMHRIHHSVIPKETHSNFSSVFSFWDALFGTYRPAPESEIEFGLPGSKSS